MTNPMPARDRIRVRDGTLTVGKMRGLQQISNKQGIFVIMAMDQRRTIRAMIDSRAPNQVPVEKIITLKLQLASAFSPLASAVLADPQYSAPESIAHATLSGHCGLVVALEHPDHDQIGDVRRNRILDNWGVEKIKRMGGSAVKLLVRYNPDQQETAEWQEQLVQETYEHCVKWDIPLVLETLVYGLGGMREDSPEFAARKPDLVVRSAKRLTPYCDLYKAEFPANINYVKDEHKLVEWCRQLDDSSKAPWVVLSAGVDIDQFQDIVRIACQNGASGFLAGRAIWKKATTIVDDVSRMRWLQTEGIANLQALISVANQYATPWYERGGIMLPKATTVDDTWYESY